MRGIWGYCVFIVIMVAIYGVTQVNAQERLENPLKWPEQTIVITLPEGATQVALKDLSHLYNICPELLYKANQSLFKYPDGFDLDLTFKAKTKFFYVEVDTSIVIPTHEACYDNFVFEDEQYNTILDLEHSLNMCWEEFIDRISVVDNEDYSMRTWHVSVPRSAPSCYNDQDQRLTYYSHTGQPLLTPHYTSQRWIRFTDQEFPDVPYCRGDLIRANPSLNIRDYHYQPGMTLFIDDSVRLCETVTMPLRPPWVWIDGVSFEQNICFDDLIEANMPWFASTGRRFDGRADIPHNHPPCYDQYRRRLGYRDRGVYYPSWSEKLKEVADKHNICLQDLLDANPIWSKNGIRLRVPMVFIPDTTPCDLGQFYRTNGFETLYDVSQLYNVCPYWIQNASPSIEGLEWDQPLPSDLQLKIPTKLPCWTTSYYQGADGSRPYETMIPYACYRQPIDFTRDHIGTEPPVSLEPDANTDYCYEVGKKPILYENKFYVPIWAMGFDSFYEIAACYDIDFNEFIALNEIPSIKRLRSESSMFIPQGREYCDWSVLNARLGHPDERGIYTVKAGDTLSTLEQRLGYKTGMIAAENNLDSLDVIYPYQELRMPSLSVYDVGHLNDKGIYVVTTGDTLSSIGQRFGYLPSMIAAENNLDSLDVIYPYQELRMPRIPPLYDIGKAMLYVGGVGVGMIGFGLYRMRIRQRSMSKKKNGEVKSV